VWDFFRPIFCLKLLAKNQIHFFLRTVKTKKRRKKLPYFGGVSSGGFSVSCFYRSSLGRGCRRWLVCGVYFFKREESDLGPGKVGAGILKKGQEKTSLFFLGFLAGAVSCFFSVRRWRCCVCVCVCV